MVWEVSSHPSLPNPNTKTVTEKMKVQYTATTLLQQLMKKVLDSSPKEDQTLIAEELVRSLSSEMLVSTTPAVLMDTAFRLGYFYRVFLERNDVVVRTESTESTTIG